MRLIFIACITLLKISSPSWGWEIENHLQFQCAKTNEVSVNSEGVFENDISIDVFSDKVMNLPEDFKIFINSKGKKLIISSNTRVNLFITRNIELPGGRNQYGAFGKEGFHTFYKNKEYFKMSDDLIYLRANAYWSYEFSISKFKGGDWIGVYSIFNAKEAEVKIFTFDCDLAFGSIIQTLNHFRDISSIY